MNTKKYNWILYLITATILITIAVQVYWNYKNYLLNKQRIHNEIQLSLDDSLESYYAEIAKTDFLTIIKSDVVQSETIDAFFTSSNLNDEHTRSIKIITRENEFENNVDSVFVKIQNDLQKKLKTDRLEGVDSIIGYTKFSKDGTGYTLERPNTFTKSKVVKGRKAFDSLKLLNNLKHVFITINRDSLEYKMVDSILKKQFLNKKIHIQYSLQHYKSDSLIYNSNIAFLNTKNNLNIFSKSSFLKPNEKINLLYSASFTETLKRGFFGILLSLLLALATISSLFYLLKIIRKQKQVSEIKNDLISNITHEFKTPISTISVALESIKSFSAKNNHIKTNNYLNISGEQLLKLNTMVEKLLETASLESDHLNLNKEQTDIVILIQLIIEKHQLQSQNKKLIFNSNSKSAISFVDAFHLENAINNIIDNAMKYGGNEIIINLKQYSNSLEILISDNGNSITKANKNKVFEKFYRIPKGNTHNIKGFGIGLYYTKKIVEKHHGTIHLDLTTNLTTFKISIPNE